MCSSITLWQESGYLNGSWEKERLKETLQSIPISLSPAMFSFIRRETSRRSFSLKRWCLKTPKTSWKTLNRLKVKFSLIWVNFTRKCLQLSSNTCDESLPSQRPKWSGTSMLSRWTEIWWGWTNDNWPPMLDLNRLIIKSFFNSRRLNPLGFV